MNKNIMKHPESLADDIFYCAGVLCTVSFITVARNISVLCGRYLPFSGNFYMRFHEPEVWRWIFPVAASAGSVFLFAAWRKKFGHGSIRTNAASFLTGAAVVMLFETIVHTFGYLLGTTGILF